MTSPVAYVSSTSLSKVYGVPAPGGDGKTMLSAAERSGLPTRAALLVWPNVETTGRYLDYRNVKTENGVDKGPGVYYGSQTRREKTPPDFEIAGTRLYNSLLITMMRAMGVQPPEYETSPGAGFGAYGPNTWGQYNMDEGKKPLPFIDGST